MTAQKFSTFHTLGELERNKFLTVFAMSVQKLQLGGFPSPGSCSKFF